MSRFERIGVFGGTFDPVHNAHLAIARAAMKQAVLDRVLFVVAATPPHKSNSVYASGEDRYALARAAVSGQPGMEVSRIELDRPGISYTVDTLRTLELEYPGVTLSLIIGFDSLMDLPNWKQADKIIQLARLLVVPRPGEEMVAPAVLNGYYDILTFEETPLSSTVVREMIRKGLPLGEMVPPGVERLIRSRGLYHVGDGNTEG